MLRGLTTVTFWADDVEEATRWYAEVLGAEAYFERKGPDGRVAYAEFRLGDHQHELGFADRRYAPHPTTEPTGAVVYWHVDDLTAALGRLLSMGATQHEAPTERGPGFVTASVADPFGNILGMMYNAHYLEVLEGRA
ncbi:VOC family protein [Microbispora sp. CA-135349]|uniref:VOC family protein n=1 Tax=Microbispora sp. CA-135349 TaxID=3239953 RepID=UPI003D8B65C9